MCIILMANALVCTAAEVDALKANLVGLLLKGGSGAILAGVLAWCVVRFDAR